MLTSEKVALAAHLHVVLRRKTGRVTDVEWMAANAEYATEIIRFARQKAVEENAPELAEWADKLARAMAAPQPPARRPLLERSSPAAPTSQPGRPSGFAPSGYAESGFADSRRPPEPGDDNDPSDSRYVGGLR